MSAMSLFSRNADLPGLQGVVRDCSATGKGFKRLAPGDIAVVDAPDIDRSLAQRLIDTKVAVVINTSQFTTGSVPNYGPQMMLDAGMLLIEGVGSDVWSSVKDGKKGRVTDEGKLFFGERLVASGTVLEQEWAESAFSDAQQSLMDDMEAFFGNTIQFIHSETPLLIDGIGIPSTGIDFKDRKVLVVGPGYEHRKQVKELRNFIREYDPVLVGVDEAADTLVDLGYKPDLIVGNPAGIGAEALRSGAKVVLPADPDGHAIGLERSQDLGVGAMTFPAASDSATDLALLLADYHGASMIVNAGSPLDLGMIFNEEPEATPSALLTRAKVGAKLVDARSVIELYTIRSAGNLGWLWVIFGLLVAVGVIVAIAGTAGDGSFADNLVNTWNNMTGTVRGWFR